MTPARRQIWLKAPLIAAFWLFLSLLCAPAFALGPSQPAWKNLTPARQEALKPLAGQWDKFDDLRKKKWLAVADKYPGMKPEEQKRLQTRMADWVKLTPEQRRTARETYKSTQAVPVEQKKAEWQQYQSLTDAQKKQLAAQAEAKKPVKEKAARRQMATRGSKPQPATKPVQGTAPVATPTTTTAIAPPATAPASAPPAAAAPATPAVAPAAPAPTQAAPVSAPMPATNQSSSTNP